MKVREAIRLLKKMPMDSEIYWQDFDCEEYGMSSGLSLISIVDFDNIPKEAELDNEFKLTGKLVVMKGG